jgi:hypothetical protein
VVRGRFRGKLLCLSNERALSKLSSHIQLPPLAGAALAEWLAGRRRDVILSVDSELEEAHSNADDVETTMLLFFGVFAALYADLDEPIPFGVESTEEIVNGIARGIPPSRASRVFLQRAPDMIHRIRSGISSPWTLIPRSASTKVLEASTEVLDHFRQKKRQSVGYAPMSDTENRRP